MNTKKFSAKKLADLGLGDSSVVDYSAYEAATQKIEELNDLVFRFIEHRDAERLKLDAAQSELAALREELANNADIMEGQRSTILVRGETISDLKQRLTAAEQRNAELVELCAKVCEERAAYYEAGDDDAPGSRRAGACQSCADVIRHRIPTESGASE